MLRADTESGGPKSPASGFRSLAGFQKAEPSVFGTGLRVVYRRHSAIAEYELERTRYRLVAGI
jgi:hypothetical protein